MRSGDEYVTTLDTPPFSPDWVVHWLKDRSWFATEYHFDASFPVVHTLSTNVTSDGMLPVNVARTVGSFGAWIWFA